MRLWNINPIQREDDGTKFYTVTAESNGDQITFTVETEREARTLRDTLNKLGTAVTCYAIAS